MKVWATIIGMVFLTLCVQANAEDVERDQITVVVPTLSGTESLGQSVAIFLKLQITQTFRSEDRSRPEANLGRGATYFIPLPLAKASGREAERLARITGAQLALWGNVVPFGSGAVAQTFLSVPKPYLDFRETRNEVWQVKLDDSVLELDVPRRTIAFSPITLNQKQVRQYSKGKYPIFCKNKQLTDCVTGDPDEVYKTRSREGNGFVRVRFRGETWWMYLPLIDKNQSQAVNYTGALIAYLRGDWNHVLTLTQKVLSGSASTESKIDAHIYRAMAKFKLGQSGSNELEAAYKLNPYSAVTIRYLVMGYIEDAIKSGNDRENQKNRALLARKYLEENKKLFKNGDVWVETALGVSQKITASVN